VSFNGGNFGRLMLQRVESMHIAYKACTGATTSAIHIAIENIFLMAGVSLPQ
jgi:hypothetical protein